MTEQEKIKQLIRQEYMRSAADPVHFAKKYCYIQHPQRGRILFHLYPFQEDVLVAFKENRYNIINKSRQLGISTLAAMYILHMMLFNSDKNILVVATKEKTAKNMVTKVKFMYDNLPSWLRGSQKPLESNKLSLKLANGSQVIAVSAAGDAGRSEAVSWLVIDEAAFISNIEKIYTSIKPTLATGGGCCALSSPNGTGGWFHKTCIDAQTKKKTDDSFNYIELKWNVHPDRLKDPEWERKERETMSPREFAQEYDCDFAGSGNTVIAPELLTFYEQTYIIPPIEKRFMEESFWIWEYSQLGRAYMVVADVARGDGADFSTFHVIDIENCEQVAEFQGQIGTREFAHMLMSVATEYNHALLVIENANVGWDVVSSVVEAGYANIYHSVRGNSENMNMEKYLDKMEGDNLIPGFTTSVRTRPLVISKMESYIKDVSFIFHSKRLLEEYRQFIWHNGKQQAQNGANDDLVMASGIALYVRDTALRYASFGAELGRSAIDNLGKSSYDVMYPVVTRNLGYIQPTEMRFGSNEPEDITWLLN